MSEGVSTIHDREQAGRSVLLLADTLPDAWGSARAARAWQVLRRLTRCHDVWLACTHGGAMHFDQWVAVESLTDRMTVSRTSRDGASLKPAFRQWLEDTSFAAVVSLSTELWPIATGVPTEQRVCDLFDRPSDRVRRQAEATRRCSWRRRMEDVDRLRHAEHRIARSAQLVLTSDFTDAANLPADAQRILVVPPAIDPSCLDLVARRKRKGKGGPKRVILQATDDASGTRRLTHMLRKAAGASAGRWELHETRGDSPRDMIDALASADVTLVPGRNAGGYRLMQAMAGGGAVAALGQTLRAARAVGQGLALSVAHDEDWVSTVERLLDDGAEAERMSKRAQDWLAARISDETDATLWLGKQDDIDLTGYAGIAAAA